MERIFARSEALLGKPNMQILKNACVMVVGIGGVGGAVCECLARTGVSRFVLVDGDVIDETNLNRQIFTCQNNIGKLKTEEMAKRILSINPSADVKTISKFLTNENITIILEDNVDYVIDCIDDIKAKVSLASVAKSQGKQIISAMGAGNRIALPNYLVTDVFKTANDPLAKVFRKKLREIGVENLDVCVAKENADIKLSPPSSVIWHPLSMGAVISAFVINKLLQKQETFKK